MFRDRVRRPIRAKLESFDESGMGYWLVRAVLADDRMFDNVYINDLLIIVAPLAAASAALVAGGRLGRANAAAGPAGRAVATTALVVGILSGVVALGVLVA